MKELSWFFSLKRAWHCIFVRPCSTCLHEQCSWLHLCLYQGPFTRRNYGIVTVNVSQEKDYKQYPNFKETYYTFCLINPSGKNYKYLLATWRLMECNGQGSDWFQFYCFLNNYKNLLLFWGEVNMRLNPKQAFKKCLPSYFSLYHLILFSFILK